MPTPKRKLSRKRRDQRSANKGIKPKSVSQCQTCQDPIATHAACQGCGYYKGNKVLRTKTDRMYERGKAREAKQTKMRDQAPVQEGQNEMKMISGDGGFDKGQD